MSYHVYIARDGWRDTPIDKDVFLSAARAHGGLDVLPVQHRKIPDLFNVHLRGRPRQFLRYMDGVIMAQAPEETLIRVMFELAGDLGAQVYSERAVAYTSVADWQKRTRDYHARREETSMEIAKKRLIRKLMILCAVLAGLLIGALFRK